MNLGKKKFKSLLRVSSRIPGMIARKGGILGATNKGFRIIKDEGFQGLVSRFLQLKDGFLFGYQDWIRLYGSLDDKTRQEMLKSISEFTHQPKISVIMPVYNPPIAFLDEAIWSVRKQIYNNWELCIADDASTNESIQLLLRQHESEDPRIKVVFREKNGHISEASNSAIELATGEFLALLDHDDCFSEHALYYVAKAILLFPDAGIIYSDEDKLDSIRGKRVDPYFKPDWNPDLFRAQNYICHLGVYRSSLVRKVGGFRIGFEGSQDYDLALRCSEQLKAEQIVHIPHVLYHWRIHDGSTSQGVLEKPYSIQVGEQAVREHLERLKISAQVETTEFYTYRVRYTIPDPNPLITLIIPTRNGYSLIKQCVESIIAKTQYSSYEILIVDNNSDEVRTLDYLESLKQNSAIRVIRDNRPFNYSSLNNSAVKLANGSLVGLLNNDVEVISPEWLTEMVSLAIRPEIGAVGARLWYPNDTLQHGGVILGLGGVAGHAHKYLPKGGGGYFGRAILLQNFSAVTAACLVIKKETYELVGGLNEKDLKVAYNDVDFCLKVREAGYWNVWTPYAELYHHESATRGYDTTPEKKKRADQEVLYMQKSWNNLLLNDPAYNPNLSLFSERFSIASEPRKTFYLD